jgi:hypothetical protein
MGQPPFEPVDAQPTVRFVDEFGSIGPIKPALQSAVGPMEISLPESLGSNGCVNSLATG